MSILVTGCAGFIGSRLCERLLELGETVTGIDSLTDYYAKDIKQTNQKAIEQHQNFQFAETDLATADLAPILNQADAVFHTAGQPGVRGSWGTQFDKYLRNNVYATQHLLESIKTLGKNIKVIYSSSSSVYGNTDQLPTSETALPQPYSPYGTTKLAAEHLCMLYHANYGIPTVSLRYFTVYGPRQRPDMAFHIFMRSILQNQPIRILGDGTQTRDFTYVDDIVDANILAWKKPVEGHIFNLGGGCRIALNGVIEMIEEITGQPIKIERADKTKGDVKDTWADTEKAKTLLGFTPSTSLQQGLTHEWEWVQSVYS